MEQFTIGRRGAVAALGAVTFLALASAGLAQGRPDARNLTCDQARALVWQNGAVVLTTGRHTYDRFVATERYCPIGHIAKRSYVQTRDAQTCAIGYICVLDTEREDRWWRLRR